MPCRLQIPKAADFRDKIGHRFHGVIIHPRTSGNRESLLLEIRHRRPIFALLLHITVRILPIADNDILRQRVGKRSGNFRAALYIIFPAGIAAIEKHIMPDHRASAVLLREFRKVRNMFAYELTVRTPAAIRAGRRLRLVAAEMDIRGIIENLDHFRDQFTENALGFRIRQTPVPSAGLVERFVFRLKIDDGMFRRAAATGPGVAVGGDLRNERDAEIFADRRETAHLRLSHLSLGPAPPRVFFALEHAPRLQDDIVEFHQCRKPYRPLDLLLAHFRNPAKMNAAEREVRSVGYRMRR